MRLKTKLSLAFGMFFIALLLLAFLGAGGIFRLNDATRVILKDNYESLDYAQEMLRTLENGDFMTFSENLQKQRQNITELGEGAITDTITTQFEQMKKTGISPEYRQALKVSIRDHIHRLWDINQEALVRKSNAARQLGINAFQIIGILSSFLVLLAFTFLFNLPSYISDPLERLKEAIRQILQRDYTARVEITGKDELGELGRAFNEMARKLDFWEHSNWAQVLFEKRRIETIIELMDDAIIGLNEHQQVLFMNPVMGKLIGVSPAEITGKNALEIALNNDLFRRLLQPEESKKGDLKIFFEGHESFFNEEKHQVYNEGVLIGQVIVLKNVTAFKELDLAKTNFIATISHELKTPLAAIKMSLKLLEDERVGELNEEQSKLAAQIRDDSDRLLKITAELLDLAQVETGNIRLELAPTRVEYLVGYARKAVESLLEERQIKLEIELAPDLPNILLDAEKTAWVLVNLLTNAIKHSPQGERIVVRAVKQAETLLVSVRDFGKGIEARYIPKVFDKFFRAPANGQKKPVSGTGLGLAISKEFIEAQGGRISVESTVNEGATFSFSLPLNV